MGNSLSIGLTALLAAQRSIELAGHNIANATTPNYSRRRAELASIPPGNIDRLATGGGVSIANIAAVRDDFIDRALLSQDPLASAANRKAQLLGQIERLFDIDPETSLGAAIDSFFNSFRELSRNPDGAAERGAVVGQAQNLSACFRDLAERLDLVQGDLMPHVQDVVVQVNTLSEQIAELNLRIRDSVVSGTVPHDLIDERFSALRNLAELVPIQTTEDDLCRINVRCGGTLLVANDDTTPLTVVANGAAIEVHAGESEAMLRPASGRLGALLEIANETIPTYLEQLDTLAATIVREVNQCHATGVGRDGGFTILTSASLGADPARPLDACPLPFDLEAGALYISVVDEATGEATQTRTDVNPAADSPAELAAALDAIDHLRATVVNGQLQITSETGFRFDFTNKVPTHPGALGAATPAFTGNVALDANDTYTLTVDTSGTAGGPGSAATIGTTAGLRVLVTNAAGLTIATLEVGEDYTPGRELALPGGMAVSLDAGDVTDADSLSVELAAEPDAQGVLAALGLNSLLRGSNIASFALEPRIADDPSLIAAARSSAAADNTNALRIADLDAATFDALNGDSITGSYTQLIARVGLDTQMAQRTETSARAMLEAAESQRAAVSGVNEDEEAVRLLQYQQLYSFAARYIQTIDELMNELMSI